jgi:WD40 repeat protein/tRNA A-37 threonylcarbamoyl transferase component Bud32
MPDPQPKMPFPPAEAPSADTPTLQTQHGSALPTPEVAAETRVPSSSEEELPASEKPVETMAGYEIEGELGRGGMGVVYKARQKGLGRVVALKMVLHADHAGPEERARFEREARTLASLRHEGIVQIYEVGEHQGKPFFSLEYVEGGSLDKYLAGTPLPPKEAARLVQQLARAMQAAHEAGIVHRDLKPANVLLAFSDASQKRAGEQRFREASLNAKITDFGLAKRQNEGGLSASGAVLGTPSYMAPEQAAGRVKQVGPAADVYALGAILYECLTGRPPFRAATVTDTLLQVLRSEPVPPSRLQLQVPRDLETVALKSLHKEPHRRYASAAELAEDLGRFLEGKPVLARPVGRMERAGKWVRRNPTLAATLGALAAALLGGTAVSTLFGIDASQQAREAKEARGEAEKDRDRARAQQRRAEMARHATQLRQARSAWQEHDVAEATRILDAVPPELHDAWECRHLRHLCSLKALSLLGHAGPVNGLCFSPDGQRLASASSDNTIKLWDAGTGQELLSLTGHTMTVNGVCFSPDGRRLASASMDRTVKVWDAQTGRHQLSIPTAEQMASVCFSPDGRRLVAAAADRRDATVYEVATGKLTRTLKGSRGGIFAVAWSPDGRRVAAATPSPKTPAGLPSILLWDPDTGTEVAADQDAPGAGTWTVFRCVAFSPDGQKLAAGFDNEVMVGSAKTGRAWFTLKGHAGTVNGVSFSPDGRSIASASADKTVKVWDASTGDLLHTLRAHSSAVNGVVFSPDSSWLSSAGDDRTVRVWQLNAAQAVSYPVEGQNATVWSVAFSPDGQWLASGSGMSPRDGRGEPRPVGTVVTLREAMTGQVKHLLKGHREWVTAVAFSPDSRQLASGSRDATVKLWDVATAHERITLNGHKGAVLGLVFSPDGQRLVSASADRTLKVWDVKTGREVFTLRGHDGRVAGVALSPDGRLVASASWDRTVKVWDARTGAELRTLTGHAKGVNDVCFSPSGRLLASGDGEAVIKLWDTDTGEEVRTLRGEVKAVAGNLSNVERLSFTPDGQRLAAASQDQSVRLYDVATGVEVLSLSGHTGEVHGVAFSRDGTRLISGGAGDKALSSAGEVKVWEAPASEEIAVLRHSREVTGVAWSPDGLRLASCGLDRLVKVWDARTGDLLHTLQGHTSGVVRVGFSPSRGAGRPRLLSRDSEGKTLAWDPDTGRSLPVAPGEQVPALMRSPRGDRFCWVEVLVVRLMRPAGEEERAGRRRPGPRFHAEEATRARQARLWFAAGFHWGRLADLRPLDPRPRAEEALAWIQAGESGRAARAALRALLGDPGVFRRDEVAQLAREISNLLAESHRKEIAEQRTLDTEAERRLRQVAREYEDRLRRADAEHREERQRLRGIIVAKGFSEKNYLTRRELDRVFAGGPVLPGKGGSNGPRSQGLKAAVVLPGTEFTEGRSIPACLILRSAESTARRIPGLFAPATVDPGEGAPRIHLIDRRTGKELPPRTPRIKSLKHRGFLPARGYYVSSVDLNELARLGHGEYEVFWSHAGLHSSAARFTVLPDARKLARIDPLADGGRWKFNLAEVSNAPEDGDKDAPPGISPYLWKTARVRDVEMIDLAPWLSLGVGGKYYPDPRRIPTQDDLLAVSARWGTAGGETVLRVTFTPRERGVRVLLPPEPVVLLYEEYEDSRKGKGTAKDMTKKLPRALKRWDEDQLTAPKTLEIRLPRGWNKSFGAGGKASLAVVVSSHKVLLEEPTKDLRKEQLKIDKVGTVRWSGVLRTPPSEVQLPPSARKD